MPANGRQTMLEYFILFVVYQKFYIPMNDFVENSGLEPKNGVGQGYNRCSATAYGEVDRVLRKNC